MTILTEPRLVEMLRDARDQAAGYTDPATATISVRALELVAVLSELVILRDYAYAPGRREARK